MNDTNSPDDALPALVELTYSATTDPSRYDELVRVWERYMERLAPGEVEDARNHHLRHFNRALQIFEKIGRQKQSEDRAEAVTALFQTPAFVMDGAGRVLHSNQSQTPLLLADPGSTAHLQSAMRELQSGAEVSLIPLHDPDGTLTGCAVLSPLEAVGTSAPRYLLVQSGSGADAQNMALLSRTFGLSQSEGAVLAALMEGASAAEISRTRGVSLSTTRTQIRKLLEKTGSASLADLIRQSEQIAAQKNAVQLARSMSQSAGGDKIRYDRILTDDGRLLAYRDFGARDGKCVLFIHNMMGGAIWPAAMERMAEAQGWRIIAPSRPGFGLSDSYPARDMELLRKTCSDMRALLDHLDVDQVLVFGMLSSAGLGIKFAKDHSDRARGLITLGHAGLMDDALIAAMANPSRAMAKTYRKSPTALRFLIRVAVASVDLLGPGQMLRSNFRSSKPDAELLEDDSIVEAIGEGLKHAIAQGGEAFSRDGFVALHDFRAEIAALTCPATCVIGREDTMYPAAQAERLMSDLPNYDLRIIAHAGQFVLYSKPDQVFAEMHRLWQTGA